MAPIRRAARGFTLLDLLTVLLAILVLIALLLPAIQAAREAARRVTCQNKLTQIGIALMNYQQAHCVLPPGSVSATQPVTWLQPPTGIGWIAQILPQLGEENLWLQVNADDPFASFPQAQGQPQSDAAFGSGAMGVMGGPVEESPRKVFYPRLSILECPSYAAPWGNAGQAQNNYAGVHHSVEQPISERGDGVFAVNSSESLEDLPDGRSRTLLAGEFTGGLQGHGWVFGDRSTLRNGGSLEEPPQSPMRADFEQLAGQDDSEEGRAKRQAQALQVGSFSSSHPYQVNFLFADGSVRPLSKKIDVALLRSLITRDDSAPMSEAGF